MDFDKRPHLGFLFVENIFHMIGGAASGSECFVHSVPQLDIGIGSHDLQLNNR